MKNALLALLACLLVSCEHNEHPFEVWWSTTCAVEGMPSMKTVFSRDLWLDDAGNERVYVGEVQLLLDAEVWDSWLWTVEINQREETATTVDLVHVPIPDSFTDAYDLKALEMSPLTFTEDEEGTWANMTGTCSWGGVSGELRMGMSDDCDACLDCSTVALLPPGFVVLVPVLLGIRRRKTGQAPRVA